MDKSLKFKRSFCILSGLSGAAGVVLLIVSFAINNGPPPNPTSAELTKFGQQNFGAFLHHANIPQGCAGQHVHKRDH